MNARYLLTALVWAISLIGVGLWAQGTSSERIFSTAPGADGSTTIQDVSPAATTATITGTVEDLTGGVIPGARVVLVSETSGSRTVPAVTNAAGTFVFSNVPPDTYTIDVIMPGFRALKRLGITVRDGDRMRIPTLVMQTGPAGESQVPGNGADGPTRPIISGDDIGFQPVDSPNTPAGAVAGRWMIRVDGEWLEATTPFRLVPAG